MNKQNLETIIGKHALVRKHYEDQGYEVTIDESGHVEFRTGDESWHEGHWFTDYRVFDGRVTLVDDEQPGKRRTQNNDLEAWPQWGNAR